MINIPVSVGELIDKISILEIKLERIKDPSKLKNCQYEYELLTDIQKKNKFIFKEEQIQLKLVNEKLWVIEDEMRKAEANLKFGKDFIELTRDEYKSNDQRAKIKRIINEKVGSKIIEEKDYVPYGQ